MIRIENEPYMSGEIEVRVNGESTILATGLTIRTTEDSTIQGLHFETFFGGAYVLLLKRRLLIILSCMLRTYG